MRDAPPWPEYLAEYHRTHPGITERLLGLAQDDPYRWLTAPLAEVRARRGVVLDVGCGSAPTYPYLLGSDWVGVDRSAAELAAARAAGRGPVVRASAAELPFPDGAADAVCAAMSLQVLTPPEAVFGEIRRVLAPGGTLAALLPAQAGVTRLGVRGMVSWARVAAALRIREFDWPNAEMVDRPERVLQRNGFGVRDSERRIFALTLHAPEQLDLLVDGLYLPTFDADRLVAARRRLRRWAPRGLRLPLALRRVVAVRE